MINWLFSKPWLPFFIMGVLIGITVLIKIYLIKAIVKFIRRWQNIKEGS